MSKGRVKKNLNECTRLIQSELKSRYRKLAETIQAAKYHRLDLEDLYKLKGELEKPIKLSETLSIQIEDCHPATGTYKRALPKEYQSNITVINKAIIQAQALQSRIQEPSFTVPVKQSDPKKMEEEIRSRQREIIEAFNLKPKNGIKKIKDICAAHIIDSVEQQIANFLHKQKHNLDLEAVGDYLSDPDPENQAVLKTFTGQIDLGGQSFTQGLRSFLKTFKLPGEAQKIDRLVDSFSEAYCQQNPAGNIANKDAGLLLAFQTIMLNTDAHNPSIAVKDKMDFNGLKRNIRGCNNGADFDENFLQEIYNDIKVNPFELNFVKTNPGYEIASSALNHDPIFNKLDLLLQSPKIRIQDIFPGIGNNVKVTVDKPKSWLNVLTGYEGTITLTDKKTFAKLATIQVYTPNFFSKWLFGDQSRVIIQPVYQDGKAAQEVINLTAKIAAIFQSPVTCIKATYDYLKADLQRAYEQEKKQSITKSSMNHYSWWVHGEKPAKKVQPEKSESLEPNNVVLRLVNMFSNACCPGI
jgi:guanine nucleotide exchange protein RalF